MAVAAGGCGWEGTKAAEAAIAASIEGEPERHRRGAQGQAVLGEMAWRSPGR